MVAPRGHRRYAVLPACSRRCGPRRENLCLLPGLLVFAPFSRQRLCQARGLLERAFERDLELRGFRQSSLKSTRRFAFLGRVPFLLVHKAFMGFLRHVRLGIQQRALQGVVQGPCVIIDPSCQDSAVWVGEVVHVHVHVHVEEHARTPNSRWEQTLISANEAGSASAVWQKIDR